MNSNTIRDIRQFLAEGVDEKAACSQTDWIMRKITTRFLLEQAVYISGASEHTCLFNSYYLRADDYDEGFLDSGARMFQSRKDYEDAKQREYYGNFEKIPHFYVVDGKILGPVRRGREEKEHSIEEALSLIFPELPKKVLVYTGSPESDGFFLDLTKTCEELSQKLADEAHERFGGDSDWYKDSCLGCLQIIKSHMYYFSPRHRSGQWNVTPYKHGIAEKQVFYWKFVE